MPNKASYQQLLEDLLPVPSSLLTSYKSLGLNEQELVVILQIYRFIQSQNEFPTPTELAKYVTISEQQCLEILKKLIQKNLLTIEERNNEYDQFSEAYNLDVLWERLYNQEEVIQEENIGDIFILFEQEFGRPLSPFEIETINTWLDVDMMKPELIKAALREAVLMSKLNFKYIDRILREWHRKGIRTVEQARDASRSFHMTQTKKEYEHKERDTSVYYNWLEGGN